MFRRVIAHQKKYYGSVNHFKHSVYVGLATVGGVAVDAGRNNYIDPVDTFIPIITTSLYIIYPITVPAVVVSVCGYKIGKRFN